MDVHILHTDSPSPPGGDKRMVTRLAQNTIYSKRWVVDLLLFILLVALLVVLVSEKQTYAKVLDVSRQNTQLLEEVKSCTDPAGTCAKRGDKQTRAAVENINKITIYASYCATKQPPPAKPSDVQRCVEQLLASSNP